MQLQLNKPQINEIINLLLEIKSIKQIGKQVPALKNKITKLEK